MNDFSRPSALFLVPDSDVPTGGILVMYRMVELLNAEGIRAAVLHERPGFRCSWFESTAPVVSAALRPLTSLDLLAVPEVYGPHLHRIAPGTPKIVCNQNAYLTFTGWPVGGPVDPADTPYRSPEVVGALCVSEENREYLEYAFPGLAVHRFVYGIETPDPVPPKDPVVSFMPRKNRDHAVQVLNILGQRGALDGWEVAPIDGVPHEDALRVIGRSRVFLSFGYPEGCGIPPMEALAAGCVVVGYDGAGGREYLTDATGYPVPYGDIVGFARTAERVLGTIAAGAAEPDARAAAGRRLIATTYTESAFRTTTLAAWEACIEAAGTRHVRLDAPEPDVVPALRPLHDPRDDTIERLEREIADANQQREIAVAERDAARAHTDALLRSSSWRVTAPVRAVRDALRRDLDDAG